MENERKEKINKIINSINSACARFDAIEKVPELAFEAFIIACCFIDFVAGFYGGKKSAQERGDGERFKKFVTDFLLPINSEYLPKRLYEDLRCGLVHSRAPGKTLVFASERKDGKHLTWVFLTGVTGKRLLFMRDDFLRDVKQAKEKYISQLLADDHLQENALKRLHGQGLLHTGLQVQRPT